MKDTDGDGKADEKKIIVTGYGWTGNAASIHGPFIGPNGWLYLNHGRKGHRIEHDGTITEGKAAGLWRFRHDGTQLERVAGGGFDNPVEAIFTSTGEIITTMTFFTVPKDGKRDALLHFIEGGVFPRDDERVMSVVNELKQTGDLLPALCEMGVYAPSGLEIHSGTQYGEEYSGNLFSTQFNMRRVQRHMLTRDGATFHCTAEDFLTCDDPDFHPTDILEDADGSLLVIDTGGWFRKGCPTSKIAKPDVLGAIYRVSREDVKPIEDPRGLAIDFQKQSLASLLTLLDDDRPTVRDRAIDQLARLEPNEESIRKLESALKVVALTKVKSPLRRLNFVWAMSRVESDLTLSYLHDGLLDQSSSVRIAAARSLGIRRDSSSIERLVPLLGDNQSAGVRRESATALGRIAARGTAKVREYQRTVITKALFTSLRTATKDRFLEHSLIFALIRIGEREPCLPFLADGSPHIRRCALIALDQMDNGQLTRELVTPLLDTDDPALRKRTLAVISKHTGWAEATFDLLSGWMTDPNPAADRIATLRGFLLAQVNDTTTQKFLGDSLDGTQASTAARQVLLEVVARAELKTLPKNWIAVVGKHLAHADPAVRRQAIDIIGAHNFSRFDDDLRTIAADSKSRNDVRVASLGVLASRKKSTSASEFQLLVDQLDDAPLERLAAARVLARLPLTDDQLLALAPSIEKAGPLAAPALLRAYGQSKSEKVLIAGLGNAELGNITVSELNQILKNYPESVRKSIGDLVEDDLRTPSQRKDLQSQKLHMDKLMPLLTSGDVTKGKAIFHSKKAACAACHTAGGKGGKVGPDLTGIGKIRAGRDLVEAIAFPSATFARGFRSYVIATDAGRIYTGVITRETPQTITLRSTDLAEIRISKSSIEVMKESETSIMPKGLDKTLTRDELRDLLAFLQAQK